jgi:hypothetical protein
MPNFCRPLFFFHLLHYKLSRVLNRFYDLGDFNRERSILALLKQYGPGDVTIWVSIMESGHGGAPRWLEGVNSAGKEGSVTFSLAIIEMSKSVVLRYLNGKYIRESDYKPSKAALR